MDDAYYLTTFMLGFSHNHLCLLEQACVLLAVWRDNLEHKFHHPILAQRNSIHRFTKTDIRKKHQTKLKSDIKPLKVCLEDFICHLICFIS